MHDDEDSIPTPMLPPPPSLEMLNARARCARLLREAAPGPLTKPKHIRATASPEFSGNRLASRTWPTTPIEDDSDPCPDCHGLRCVCDELAHRPGLP